jgi:hypothetical protein
MKVLFDGLVTYVNATTEDVHNAFYNAIGGRFYYEEAPQRATFPFATYEMVNATPDWSFDNDQHIYLIQIDAFSSATGMTEITTIQSAMIALFEYKDVSLTVSGYNFIYMKETYHDITKEDDYWHLIANYEIMITKAS